MWICDNDACLWKQASMRRMNPVFDSYAQINIIIYYEDFRCDSKKQKKNSNRQPEQMRIPWNKTSRRRATPVDAGR